MTRSDGQRTLKSRTFIVIVVVVVALTGVGLVMPTVSEVYRVIGLFLIVLAAIVGLVLVLRRLWR